MGEELEQRHHFVVGVFVVEVDEVHFLEGVQDEETVYMLGGADAVLMIKKGVPKRREFLLLPRFGLSHDQGVVFVEGGVVLVEQYRYPRLVLLGRVRKYEAGDFSRFQDGEANRETCLKEDFSYSSEVVILRLANNWGEGLNGSFGFGGEVG